MPVVALTKTKKKAPKPQRYKLVKPKKISDNKLHKLYYSDLPNTQREEFKQYCLTELQAGESTFYRWISAEHLPAMIVAKTIAEYLGKELDEVFTLKKVN